MTTLLKMKSFVPMLPVAAALITPAFGETLVLQGNSDSRVTHIRSDHPGKNYGTDPHTIVGRTTTPRVLRGLFSFDLSDLPAGAEITGISLTLTSMRAGPWPDENEAVTLELYDLAGDFTEGFGYQSGIDSETSANWSIRNTATPWATAGGDFSSLLSSAEVNPVTFGPGETALFESTSMFVDAAQSAFTLGERFTFLLKLNDVNEAENLRRSFFFVSDEAGLGYTRTDAPKLTIEYVPEPGSAGLMLLGLGMLLGRRRS